MFAFDYPRFVADHWEDNESIRDAFLAHGIVPPSFDQMRKWTQRGRIPGEWLVLLFFVLERRKGRPVSVENYLRKGKSCPPASKAKSSPTGALASIFD